MGKSPEAFRTISEVAETLATPAHVLRFWESRFPQIRPVKRAGGRRYYRPADVALLAGIKRLLHSEGLTIRGVQKILREQGVRHVAALGDPESEYADAFADTVDEVVIHESPLDLAAITPENTEAATVDEPVSQPPTRATESPTRTTEPMEAAGAGEPERPAGTDEAAPGVPVARPAVPFARAGDATSDSPAAAPAPPPAREPPAPLAMPPHAPADAGDEGAPQTSATPSPEAAARVPTRLSDMAARLRTLPPGSLAGRRTALAALERRMAALHARMTRT